MTSHPGGTASALAQRGRLMVKRGNVLPAPWWSLTKTAIAAAALVLVERGDLELDAPLASAPYTLRQLLQHSSGLPDYGGMAAYHDAVARGDEPWSDTDLLSRVRAHELRTPPGERFAYSNVGYLLVRRTVESTTGLALDVALRDLVFGPLGVPAVALARTPADLEQTAWGNARRYHPGWVCHGLAVGSVAQAALFVGRLLTGGLLGEALLAAMTERFPVHHAPLPGRPWVKPGYGLGLMVDLDTPLGRAYGHTGGGPGSTAAAYYFPDLDPPRAVAVLSCSEDAGAIEHAVFDLALSGGQASM
jgi:CubicO group peptidase (beta-lactamase class C family)